MITLKFDIATRTLIDAPARISRGGPRPLTLSFLSSGVKTLFEPSTVIVLEVFAPGDLENAVAGGTVTVWDRDATSLTYSGNLNTGGAILGNLALNTLYGRVKWTEPGEAVVTSEYFHILFGSKSEYGEAESIDWSRITNPPELPTVGDASGVAISAITEMAGKVNVQAALQDAATRIFAEETGRAAHQANLGNPHGVTKAQVGLGSADDTSDVAKPVSTAQQAALDGKCNVNASNLQSAAILVSHLAAEVLALIENGFDPAGYQGTWTPATDTPTMPAASAAGEWWYIAASGTASGSNADGTYTEGDLLIDNGASYDVRPVTPLSIPDSFISRKMLSSAMGSLVFDSRSFPGYALVCIDKNGRRVFAVQNDGTLDAKFPDILSFGIANGLTISSNVVSFGSREGEVPVGGSRTQVGGPSEYAYMIVDKNGRILLAATADGSLEGKFPASEWLGRTQDETVLGTYTFAGRSKSAQVALDGSGHGYIWQTLTDLPCVSLFADNDSGEEILIRPAGAERVRGYKYAGGWDADDPLPQQTVNSAEFKNGLYYEITDSANGYTAGNRLVFRAMLSNSGDSLGTLTNGWEEVSAGLFYKGAHDASTASFPSTSGTLDDDYFEITTAGTMGGLAYVEGDKVVRDSTDANGWRRISEAAFEAVADMADSATFVTDTPANYEWRRRDGDEGIVYLDFTATAEEVLTAYVVKDGKFKLHLHNSRTGDIDALATVNGAFNNFAPRFSHDGRKLFFTSDRDTETGTYYLNIGTGAYYPVDRQVYRSRSTRDIAAFGDSMGSQFYSEGLTQVVPGWDSGAGRAARTITNYAKASLNPHQILDTLRHYAISGGGASEQIIAYFLDRGYDNDDQIATWNEAYGWIRARMMKAIVLGLFPTRTMTWTGSTFSFSQGKVGNGAAWQAGQAIEQYMADNFANIWINVRTALFEDLTTEQKAYPDPQFPGSSIEDIYTTHGLHPPLMADYEQVGWGRYYHDNAALFVSDRFQGYRNDIPGDPGSTLNDYWLITGTGVTISSRASGPGDMLMWNGSAWVGTSFDHLHLVDEANALLATKLTQLLETKGWA